MQYLPIFYFFFYRLEYICLIFKELVFSRPLSLCYVSLLHFVMVFSKCSTFIPKLCKSSRKYIVNKNLVITFLIIIYNYIYIYIYIILMLIILTDSTAIKMWKGALHFTPGTLYYFKIIFKNIYSIFMAYFLHKKIDQRLTNVCSLMHMHFRCMCFTNSHSTNGAFSSRFSYYCKYDALINIVCMVYLADE